MEFLEVVEDYIELSEIFGSPWMIRAAWGMQASVKDQSFPSPSTQGTSALLPCQFW